MERTVDIVEVSQRILSEDLRAVELRRTREAALGTGPMLPIWAQNRLLVFGASTIALFGIHALRGPSAAVADTCTTTTTVESTTTVCGPDQSAPNQPPEPDSSPQTTPEKTVPKLRRRVSYDMCDWGERICTTGCGDVVSADAITDLTGKEETPADMLPILSPNYYIPGSGTRPEAFAVIARRFHLKEGTSNLTGAKKAITEDGGLAIAEFNAALADQRSGNSPIAVDDHYVVLDRSKDGRFAIADPHQAKGRYTQTNPDGSTHWWSVQALNAAGLTHVWTMTRTGQ